VKAVFASLIEGLPNSWLAMSATFLIRSKLFGLISDNQLPNGSPARSSTSMRTEDIAMTDSD
jgi:hypothetical protein